jgi:hypothetical protein
MVNATSNASADVLAADNNATAPSTPLDILVDIAGGLAHDPAVQVLACLLAMALVCCVLPLYLVRDKPFLNRLCAGNLKSARLNTLLCVPVMCFNAFNIYVIPCCGAIAGTAVDFIIAPILQRLPSCCCRHTDRTFPPEASSIGTWDGKSFSDNDVEWVRARKLLEAVEGGKITRRVKLFEGGIEPKDVGQGAVGDCWLIAAFACAAEHPGLLANTFLTKRANQRGKYTVKLFDWQRRCWVKVSIDENIPTRRGASALFAQPRGGELWVAMLEKAFAKFCGSYGALDGGHTAWALNALTGDPVWRLDKESDSKWHRCDMVAKQDPKNKRAVSFIRLPEHDQYDSARTFFLVRKYCSRKALMGASFGSYGGGGGGGLNGEDMGPQGLVAGHAYSILDAKCFRLPKKTKQKSKPKKKKKKADASGLPEAEALPPPSAPPSPPPSPPPGDKQAKAPPERLMLVQLRNPWGKGEWEGAWSDGSDEWSEHPDVRSIVRPKEEEDGAFWMSWDDFCRVFTQIEICSRTTGIHDLQLDMKEADHCVTNCYGPCKGCCLGCVTYWCCGQGCNALYGAGNGGGSDVTVTIEGNLDERDDTMGAIISQKLERMTETVQNM